jgi:hypothetical protein
MLNDHMMRGMHFGCFHAGPMNCRSLRPNWSGSPWGVSSCMAGSGSSAQEVIQ